ncbi:MAG: hypothetical protein FJX78_10290 [Armatimonadetes bacterium]|nr:hypothetical protein [Armatimonadota bacterium]
MTASLLRAPRHDGEIVCEPPVSTWLELARANQAALATAAVRVGAAALADWRSIARRQALDRALAYTRRLGESPDDADPGHLIVGTGHQPAFFHPGIWIKNWIVEATARTGVTTLNLVVDNDEAGSVVVRSPRRNGRLGQACRILVDGPAGAPFETMPPPAAGAWRAFVEDLRADVATLAMPSLAARLDELAAAGAAARDAAPDLGNFLTRIRRTLQNRDREPQRTLELPVSHMAETAAFRAFCGAWITRFDAYWEATNAAMDEHRATERVRSAAQPFPNLGRVGDRLELPFWIVQDGTRHPLLARRVRGGFEIGTPASTLAVLPSDDVDDALANNALAIRPRALTLTLFARLGVFDLFVHGVGGARYDRATDRVARAVFGFDPPRFAVATGTFHLPLGGVEDVATIRRNLERRLIELSHNPDRFLPDARRHPLVGEKWREIHALASEALTRKSRRETTQRIREINVELARSLSDRAAAARAALEALAITAAEEAVARDREYPYFYFDAATLALTARNLVVERAAR